MEQPKLYTRCFAQVFISITFVMTGVALQFHFADYISYLGHKLDVFGLVVALSTTALLLSRIRIGAWIDKFGCKPMWLICSVIVAGSLAAMQFTQSLVLITILRGISQIASFSIMTAGTVFAAQIAPPKRRAESIGIIGLAGFMGMMLGSTLGDVILTKDSASISIYRTFFSISAISYLISGAIILFTTLPESPSSVRNLSQKCSNSYFYQLKLIWNHWPGTILLIGIIFSAVHAFQFNYLERLAEERAFERISVYFLAYGTTAIILRILTKKLPEQIGRTRTIIIGMVLQIIGLYFITDVYSQIDLILPGILMGSGHCFIFPSMIDLGADKLPDENRGTGTSVILGAGDLGMLSGSFLLGKVIEIKDFNFAITALMIAVAITAVIFTWSRRSVVFYRQKSIPVPAVEPQPESA